MRRTRATWAVGAALMGALLGGCSIEGTRQRGDECLQDRECVAPLRCEVTPDGRSLCVTPVRLDAGPPVDAGAATPDAPAAPDAPATPDAPDAPPIPDVAAANDVRADAPIDAPIDAGVAASDLGSADADRPDGDDGAG